MSDLYEKEDMTDKKTPAQKAGYLFGLVLSGCMTAVVIALTAKFIMWLF